ncbi:hypothetical protein JHK87_030214 [Glycine soja]|nr:hypothetical protein JHK87_030214 [Glycine soja]KAG4993586.1 hypothetical protein JHK86_030413 [Glycine max]
METTLVSKMQFAAFFCLALWLGFQLEQVHCSVTYDRKAILINGQRRILFSGSIHYPRSTPDMWEDLIYKAKEGGLDVIETYIFWNVHEPSRGNYNFEGRYDLVRFVKTIQKAGLYAHLRIGPYVCAEWNFGGFPVWLKYVPGISFRTDNEPFKKAMQGFTEKIVGMMKSERLYESQGGPIILSQYHGGTNFGRTAGGPFITTSYDYDAPLDEYGLIRQPKYGHLKELHKAIKMCERALVSADPAVTSMGNFQQAHVYTTKSGDCAAFLSNFDTKSSVRVMFNNMHYNLPPWSISILPDCRNVVFNTAKVGVQTSQMQMLPTNTHMFSWESFDEDISSLDDGSAITITTSGLLEQINVTRDTSDYLWYITSVAVGLPVGLKGEAMNLASPNGISSVEWMQSALVSEKNQPLTWHKTYFDAPDGDEPLALDMEGMGKGQIWINGLSIGRYWTAPAAGICNGCSYAGTFRPPKCQVGCGQPTQRWYHVPRSWLKPNHNLLVVFEELGGDPSKISLVKRSVSSICADVSEYHPNIRNWHIDSYGKSEEFHPPKVHLHCSPSQAISSIKFASFGTPLGTCGNYEKGVCHSPTSYATLEKKCIGKPRCTVTVSNSNFGQDPCPNVLKRLSVEAVCSPTNRRG